MFLDYLNSFVNVVWNEEDENSSILKAIKIAVETEMEIDDLAMEEKSSKELGKEDLKGDEQNQETTSIHNAFISLFYDNFHLHII